MKIIIIGAFPESLLKFRGNLIRELSASGKDVIAVSGKTNKDVRDQIKNLNAQHEEIFISRTSLNPFHDIATFISIINLFIKEKPKIVISYTSKPIIWSGIAKIFFPDIRLISLVTGLGFFFEGKNIFRKIIRSIMKTLYKISLKQSEKVIFQNNENKKVFIQSNIVNEDKCFIINGSGVDINYYNYVKPRNSFSSINFLMIARLLKDKGVVEFLKAAEMTHNSFKEASFTIVGGEDSSPNRVNKKVLEKYKKLKFIKFEGHVKEVKKYLIDSDVFVLPSYHEGMSRSLQEAMAIGRPLITTNIPGCKETVKDKLNGFLVEKKSYKQLADKMMWFCQNKHVVEQMGKKSRELCEKNFDVRKINKQLIKLILK